MAFHVEKTREGRNFAVRRVVAQQLGKTVFTLACSFQDPSDDYEHQNTSIAPPPVPELAAVQDWRLPGRDEERVSMVDRVLDIRLVARDLPKARKQMWIRTRDKLKDASLAHAGALTYLSDFQLAFTTAFPHDLPRHLDVVSLDHTVWLHRSLRADDWLFVTQESTIANASRGLAAGKFHNQAGQLVASVVQEVLFVRNVPPPGDSFGRSLVGTTSEPSND
jgi:acyl-CoA thioesterase-2